MWPLETSRGSDCHRRKYADRRHARWSPQATKMYHVHRAHAGRDNAKQEHICQHAVDLRSSPNLCCETGQNQVGFFLLFITREWRSGADRGAEAAETTGPKVGTGWQLHTFTCLHQQPPRSEHNHRRNSSDGLHLSPRYELNTQLTHACSQCKRTLTHTRPRCWHSITPQSWTPT